jgi:hypothetical protein
MTRPWPAGLHEIHCREDRCVLGCDCPCHRGEPVPQLRKRRIRRFLLWLLPARRVAVDIRRGAVDGLDWIWHG